MTGYGRETAEIEGTRLTIEVRSVNHRFLDISAKMPRTFLFLEDKMKKLIKNDISRGRVDVYVTMEGEGITERSLKVDWDLLEQYINQLKVVKGHYGLTGDVSVDIVTKLEDLFTVQETDQHQDELQQMLLDSLQKAVGKLVDMRKDEGDALRDDLKARLGEVRNFVNQLEDRRELVIDTYKNRIKSRIQEYVRESFQIEDSRIMQEVALLAEKGDITEEITRLHSHIDQFSSTLGKQQSIGRQLDFIVQEMHREVNTIGSKSNDAKISEWVVSLKSEIEKMKEQVQNVE
nr:YicC/YloC family endoribonuclease [Thalassobacillus pellis]